MTTEPAHQVANIRGMFQGKQMTNKYAASCLRCDCPIAVGSQVVYLRTSGVSHLPGDCPPHDERPTQQAWMQALEQEQKRLAMEHPHPRPLRVLYRLAEIAEELAAGYPGGAQ